MLPASLSPAVPRQRAALLAQWSRLLTAGLPPLQVADLLDTGARGAQARALARAVAGSLRAGLAVAPALRGLEELPSHHAAIVAAGEAGGTLPDLLARLAADGEREAESKTRLLRSLAYPALIFLVAGLVLPLPSLILGNPGAALATALLLLGVPAAGLFALAAGAGAVTRGERWPSRLPGAAPLIELAARARWCRVASRLLGAGLALPATLAAAAEAAGGGRVGEAARRVRRDVERGRPLGASVVAQGLLTPESSPLAAEADAIGTGEAAYARAATLIESEFDRLLQARMRLLSALAFALAAGFVAWTVIAFWSAHSARLD